MIHHQPSPLLRSSSCVKLVYAGLIAFVFLLAGCATKVVTYDFDVKSEVPNASNYFNGKIYVSEDNNGTCHLVLYGFITRDSARAFMLASNDIDKRSCKQRKVIFESQGGNVRAAMEIGKAIRSKGYTTAMAIGAGAICDSSCGIVFISGVNRLLSTGIGVLGLGEQRIGFHQLSINKNGQRICVDPNPSNLQNKLVSEYASQMLPPQSAKLFSDLVLETNCKDIKRVSAQELISSGIATGS